MTNTYRINFISIFTIIAIFLITSSLWAREKQPVFSIDSDTFAFDPIIEGDSIHHTFSITNKGDATLYIKKVIPTCGCTTTNFDKEIPPGQTGKLQAKFDSTGYADRNVSKTIHVHTNDPAQNKIPLYIKGKVTRFALVRPKSIRLKGDPSLNISKTISIITLPSHPFKVIGVSALKGENLAFNISQAPHSLRDVYELTVKNIKQTPGRYYDRIIIKTDSDVKPEIHIPVYGHLEKSNTD